MRAQTKQASCYNSFVSSDENSRNSEGLRGLEITRRFVTNFWEHPLLDKETKEHREKFKTVAKTVLEGAGLEPSDYVAVPVGGVRWAVAETSDFDAVVCYDNNAFKKINNKFSELKRQNDFDEQQRLIFDVNEDNWMKGLDLLFTPDDYIVGNLEAAWKIRLKMMEIIKEKGGESFWRETIDTYYRRTFVWWDLNVYAPPGKEREVLQGKRRKRIYDRLARKAAKSSDPEAYINDFDIYRRKMTLPLFEDYYNGLNYSSGKLEIDSRYANEGVES